MAQRMESVAPPGGVMLSASTARLVDGAAALGEPELVQIKGADEPVPARRLLGMGERHRAVGRAESNLVGRRWEMSAVEGLLDRAHRRPRRGGRRGGATGHRQEPSGARGCRDGSVAAVSRCSPPSANRTPARSPSMSSRGCCARPPASRVLTRQAARDRVRAQVPDADPEDLLLFDDLLGIADPECCRCPRSIRMRGGGG